MHKYYEMCINNPILQMASAKLPWGHNILIFDKIKDDDIRLWYINETAKTGKDSNKRFQLNGDLVTINNKITELNEKVAAIEYKKIAIKNEIDILNGNAPDGRNRIPISSHAVIKYQPVKEFSLELWDLMLEKAIVYKDKIEFVWKE